MRLCNSAVRIDWKSADEMATPPTWPIPRKSWPNPVPTAKASSVILSIIGSSITLQREPLTGYMRQKGDCRSTRRHIAEWFGGYKITHSTWSAGRLRYRSQGVSARQISTCTESTRAILTMLSHSCTGGEFSCIKASRTAATNGKIPKIRFSFLYLPVRCMTHLRTTVLTQMSRYSKNKHTHPAKREPQDTEIPLGMRWAPM